MSSKRQVSLEAQLQLLRQQIIHIEKQIELANSQQEHGSHLSFESLLEPHYVLEPADSCSSLEPPTGNYEPLYKDDNVEYQELLNQVQHVLEEKKEIEQEEPSDYTVDHLLQLVNDVLKPKEVNNIKNTYMPKIEYDTMISEEDTMLEGLVERIQAKYLDRTQLNPKVCMPKHEPISMASLEYMKKHSLLLPIEEEEEEDYNILDIDRIRNLPKYI